MLTLFQVDQERGSIMTLKLIAGLAEYAQAHPPSSGDTVANSEAAKAETACSSDTTFTGDPAHDLEEHPRTSIYRGEPI